MRVVVSSANPVKIAAAEDAFSQCFPNTDIVVASVSVASGISDQPMSDSETLSGAKNRAMNAQQESANADYWLGLEGGIEIVDGKFMASAWMVIRNSVGQLGMARTPSLPLPPEIQSLVESGLELGDANDKVFSTFDSKRGGGAYGLLSDGRFTRQGIYAQTICIALIPFLHPLFEQGART